MKLHQPSLEIASADQITPILALPVAHVCTFQDVVVHPGSLHEHRDVGARMEQKDKTIEKIASYLCIYTHVAAFSLRKKTN